MRFKTFVFAAFAALLLASPDHRVGREACGDGKMCPQHGRVLQP